MNLQKIESLIRKFEEGDTTLEEELELKVFFASENVPQHLAGFKDLFAFYRKSAEEVIPDPGFDERVLRAIADTAPEKHEKGMLRKLYPVLSVAAALLLLVGTYVILVNRQSARDTFDDPALAYAETKKILMRVSDNLNTGVEEMSPMKEINAGMEDLSNIKTFDEGMKNMRRISVLDKSKDIITQKTN